MGSLEDRIKGVHPNALKRVRLGAQYVSDGLQEYYIKRDHFGYYSIVRYGGGYLAPYLRGSYTSHIKAHQRLVGHLQKTNKFGRAIWPELKQLNSIEPS